MIISSLTQIETRARQNRKEVNILCVQPYDCSTIEALSSVKSWGDNYRLTLFGNRKEMLYCGEDEWFADADIFEGESEEENASKAIEMIPRMHSALLMKGLVNTAVFLKVLLKSAIVRTSGRLISHVSCLEIPGFERLLFITDGTVNVAPDLKAKMCIVDNVARFVRSLGQKMPKIAIVGINERITPSNQDLLDGAVLSKMAERGEFGDCYVDGPMPLDTAIKKDAAQKKGILSPVGGEADILVCSNLESAANLIKGLVHLGNASTAGLLLGAGFPVVLTSRSDSKESKRISLAMAIINTLEAGEE